MEQSWILLLAMIGHVLCVYADRLLLCTPGGQFGFSDMKDNSRMARLFVTKPESDPLWSIVLGTLAMFLQFFGYLALGIWMRPYSALWANMMIVGAAMIYTFGLAHHILGCAAEWIKKSIRARFDSSLAERSIREGKWEYRRLLSCADDLGPGNPMAMNAAGAASSATSASFGTRSTPGTAGSAARVFDKTGGRRDET